MDIDVYVQQSLRSSRTMADAIADALRRAILAGALPAGKILRQEALASKFGVSRVPIREALLKLETDGLVVSQPRRGTVVTALDADTFQEILEMRASLELLALRVAIPKMTQLDLTEAARILDEADAGLHHVTPSRRDATQEFETRWGEANWQFHCALYKPAQRPRLMDTIKSLHLQFARHLRARLEIVAPTLLPSAHSSETPDLDEWEGVMKEHRQILEACQRGETGAACSMLERHITVHGEELVRRLRTA